jgi:hypothetical protein
MILVSSLFLNILNICSSHTPDVQDTVSQNISLFPRQCNQKARYINIKRNLNVIQSVMENSERDLFITTIYGCGVSRLVFLQFLSAVRACESILSHRLISVDSVSQRSRNSVGDLNIEPQNPLHYTTAFARAIEVHRALLWRHINMICYKISV